MNTSLLNKILNREHLKNDILNFIKDFYSNPNDLSKYRGLYLYGEPGIGKTMFIKNILHEYDIFMKILSESFRQGVIFFWLPANRGMAQ